MGSPGGYAARMMVFPPEKGSFPLDHFGECIQFTNAYKECLAENDNMSAPCHHLAKDYLQCRMDKGLMAKEDLDTLGFKRPPVPTEKPSSDDGRSTTEVTIAGYKQLKRLQELRNPSQERRDEQNETNHGQTPSDK